MKKNLFAIILVCLTLLFNSCSKEGPAGPAGPAGTNGTTNVISEYINLSSGYWTSSVTNGITSWDATYYTPNITQSVVNSGAVITYLNTNNSYTALPCIFNAGLSSVNTCKAFIKLNTINFRIENLAFNPAGSTVVNFKAVIVQP